MAFIHALHLVLFGLLVATNLLLIPLVAMGGFRFGEGFARHLTQNQDLLAVLPVLAAFMSVGLVNGLMALVILSNTPSLTLGGSRGDGPDAFRGGASSDAIAPGKSAAGRKKAVRKAVRRKR